MTSQIVLVNQAGVALASDTMTSWNAHGGGSKTSPTANKIYELGGAHKVVALHSGSTRVGALTYELLVREWASTRTEPLGKLADYPAAFQAWLREFKTLPIDEGEEGPAILRLTFYNVLDGCDWLGQVVKGEHFDSIPAELEDFLCSVLEDYAENAIVAERDLVVGLSEKEVRTALQEPRWKAVNELFLDVVEGFLHRRPEWQFSEKISKALLDFATKRLMYFCLSPASGELTWAGFGNEEPIGGVARMRVNGFYLGRLQAADAVRVPGADEPRTHVATIAQTDAVDDFLYGLSYPRRRMLVHLAVKALHDTADDIPGEMLDAFGNTFFPALREYLDSEFKEATASTLEGLSIPNLVGLAESLVNLQRLRASMSRYEATVGGVIESMSITRWDGLKWHSRLGDAGHGGPIHSAHPLL